MIDKNVGGYDRIARGVLAVVSAAVSVAALAGMAGLGEPAGTFVGAVALLAAAGLTFNVVTQRCFGNSVLGIDTCSTEE